MNCPKCGEKLQRGAGSRMICYKCLRGYSYREQQRFVPKEDKIMDKAMAALPEDDPIMKKWNRYKQTKEYENTKKWCAQPEHVDGSLWAAFLKGYQSGIEESNSG